jgi:hypothetical protein
MKIPEISANIGVLEQVVQLWRLQDLSWKPLSVK